MSCVYTEVGNEVSKTTVTSEYGDESEVTVSSHNSKKKSEII